MRISRRLHSMVGGQLQAPAVLLREESHPHPLDRKVAGCIQKPAWTTWTEGQFSLLPELEFPVCRPYEQSETVRHIHKQTPWPLVR
jgi:Fe-S cluster biosynthesis and repair protein YggX